jgi:hypothetical protein
MPKFLEKKLKKQYGSNSAIPYKIMNRLGFMHGNKETAAGRAAGRAATKKHASKFAKSVRNARQRDLKGD